MRRAMLTLVPLLVVALALVFVFIPLAPVGYWCMGGLACVHNVSLSCITLGFGSYSVYSGRYFLTYHCPTA